MQQAPGALCQGIQGLGTTGRQAKLPRSFSTTSLGTGAKGRREDAEGWGWPATALEYERKGGWDGVVPCGAQPGWYLDWFKEWKTANEGWHYSWQNKKKE